MPSRVSPGIVNVTDFVAAHAKKFGSYINYIDREEAIRIDHFDQQNILSVDGYNHYMENPKKSSGIFTDRIRSSNTNTTRSVKETIHRCTKASVSYVAVRIQFPK